MVMIKFFISFDYIFIIISNYPHRKNIEKLVSRNKLIFLNDFPDLNYFAEITRAGAKDGMDISSEFVPVKDDTFSIKINQIG
jgi:hypothetical protein